MLEVFVDNDNILLKKCMEGDIFTGSTEDLIDYQGKKISKQTIKELAKLLN